MGKPYFDTHILRVVAAVPDFAKPAAALHDVIEDTETTGLDLEEAGFSEATLGAVRDLTHERGENYDDYIKGLTDRIALTVKAADLMDNLSTYPEGSKRGTYLKALRDVIDQLLSLAPKG